MVLASDMNSRDHQSSCDEEVSQDPNATKDVSYHLFSVSGEILETRLKIPLEGSECPIALEPISSVEVQGFEELLLIPTLPLHREILLPCQHSFAANILLSYWIVDPMRCPLCRAGFEDRLAIDSLPVSWHKQAVAHKRRRRHIDATEAMLEAQRDNSTESREMLCFMVVSLCAPGGRVIVVPISFQSPPRFHGEQLHLAVGRSQVRQIASLIARENVFAISLSVCLQVENNDSDSSSTEEESINYVSIAESGVMLLPSTSLAGPPGHVAHVNIVHTARQPRDNTNRVPSHVDFNPWIASYNHSLRRHGDSNTPRPSPIWNLNAPSSDAMDQQVREQLVQQSNETNLQPEEDTNPPTREETVPLQQESAETLPEEQTTPASCSAFHLKWMMFASNEHHNTLLSLEYVLTPTTLLHLVAHAASGNAM